MKRLAILTFAICGAALPALAEDRTRVHDTTYEWAYTGLVTDWGGRDYACSRGLLPSTRYCAEATDASRHGTVAVCWNNTNPNYPPGIDGCDASLGGQWCVYKDVQITTAPDGNFPGFVYVCSPPQPD